MIYIYLLFTYFLQNLMPSFLCFRHDQCQVNRRQKAARALRTPRAPLAPQALWKPHWSPRCCNGQKRLERTPRYIEKVETPGWNGWRNAEDMTKEPTHRLIDVIDSWLGVLLRFFVNHFSKRCCREMGGLSCCLRYPSGCYEPGIAHPFQWLSGLLQLNVLNVLQR